MGGWMDEEGWDESEQSRVWLEGERRPQAGEKQSPQLRDIG